MNHDSIALFSESPTRFLLEVRPEFVEKITLLFDGLPLTAIGAVEANPRVLVRGLFGSSAIDATVEGLRSAWQRSTL